mgnify:CR=1 FL=1
MRILLSFLLFISVNSIYSQLRTPQASPSSKIEQAVGLTDVVLEYNRPSKKGRDIFGNLVPFGKIWRTGANSSTKIGFSTDVSVDGSKIEKGTYSVFTIPNEESWEFILYSQAELWNVPSDWSEDKIVFKSQFKAHKLEEGNFVESFTISINSLTNNGFDLVISWDDTYVIVPFSVPTRENVESQIEALMSGTPKVGDYYAAAVFYREENIKLGKALEYMNKAMEMTENPRFFQLRQQSLILAANGLYKDAIEVAKKSLELSIQANNQDYVKLNNDSIRDWEKNI